MKILIAEGDEMLLGVLAEKMEKSGYEVIRAADGDGATSALKEMPDLVLLDLQLPKRDGFAILAAMKADEKLKAIPVIIFANEGEDENVKKALAMGAEDYLLKTQHTGSDVLEKVEKRLRGGA